MAPGHLGAPMPRPLRIHVPGTFHHITLRGNHQQRIFASENDRLKLNDVVARVIARSDLRIHAYCWMTNHLHLLVEVGAEPMGIAMRLISSTYARAYQKRLPTRGHLFERRYHSRLVDVDAYLLAVVRYIHLNPVEAQMVRSAADHRWSSHYAYAGGAPEPWLTTRFVYAMLGSSRARAIAAYQRFMNDAPAGGAYPLDDGPDDSQNQSLAPVAPEPKRSAPPLNAGEKYDTTTLDDLILEACRRFGIDRAELVTSSRDIHLAKIRGWIANHALKRRIANLSEVSRAVGRERHALTYIMKRYPEDVN